MDDTVSTGNLLRQLYTVAHRLKSKELLDWTNAELNGYPRDDLQAIPSYRGPLDVPVRVRYINGQTQYLGPLDVPDERDFRHTQFNIFLNQSLAELQRLSKAELDPTQAWPGAALQQYIKWCDEDRANCLMGIYGPQEAEKVIPLTLLEGVIDTVRNRALAFALDLQAEYPEAGEPDGPTTQTEKVRDAVTMNFHTHISGGTNNLAYGQDFTQNVQVINQGDADALLTYLRGKGLDAEGQAELSAAVKTDGAKPGAAVAGFLERVGSGVIKFGTAVTAPVGVELAKAALGQYFGFPVGG